MLEFLGALINFAIRLLAVLLCLAFLVTIVIVLLLVNADSMLLSPAVYQNALVRERIYDRLPSLAAEQIHTSMHPAGEGMTWGGGSNPLQYAGPEAQSCSMEALGDQAFRDILGGLRAPSPQEISAMEACGVGGGDGGADGAPEFFKVLSIDQWGSILRALLPADWLQAQVESVLHQTFTILDTPGAPLAITIDMRDFKKRLTGPAGTEAILQIIQALPACAADYFPDLSDPSSMLECRPPDEMMVFVEPGIAPALAEAAKTIPDQLDLLEPVRASGALNLEQAGLPIGPRQILQIGRRIVRLSPIVCVVILFLVTLLVVRSWRGFLRWWGLPILAAGICVLLTALVIWVGLDVAISLGRENLPASISPGVYDTGAGILVYIAHRYALVTGGEGIVLGFIGLGLVVLSFFVGRPKHPLPASAPPAAPYAPPPSVTDDTPRASGIFG
ncbi:MAG: hypothetical protein JW748_06740 [Anaerolineales bacterium]|nr:hypothetical protein [Anaerolineales bacterium]